MKVGGGSKDKSGKVVNPASREGVSTFGGVSSPAGGVEGVEVVLVLLVVMASSACEVRCGRIVMDIIVGSKQGQQNPKHLHPFLFPNRLNMYGITYIRVVCQNWNINSHSSSSNKPVMQLRNIINPKRIFDHLKCQGIN